MDGALPGLGGAADASMLMRALPVASPRSPSVPGRFSTIPVRTFFACSLRAANRVTAGRLRTAPLSNAPEDTADVRPRSQLRHRLQEHLVDADDQPAAAAERAGELRRQGRVGTAARST